MNQTGGIPEQDKVVGGVVVAVLAVVGVIVNSATLWAIGRNRKLRQQPATVLMLSLTTADLIECGVIFPFTAQNFLKCWFCGEDDVVCTIYGFLFYWNLGAILFLQAFLAINRWTTVCCQPRWHFNVRTSLVCTAICWVLPSLSLLIPALQLFGDWAKLGYDSESDTCTLSINFRYVVFPTVLGASALVICTGYLLIIRKVRKTRKIYQNRIASSLRQITTKNKDMLQLAIGQHLKSDERVQPHQNESNSIQDAQNPNLDKANNQSEKVEPQLSAASKSSETQPSEKKKDSLRATMATISGKIGTQVTEDSVATLERQQSAKVQRRIKEEIGMTITVAVIFFSFVVLYLPGTIVLLIDPTTKIHPQAHMPTYIIMWMTGLVNPLVYVTCNQSYREAFVDLFSILSKQATKRLL